MSLLTLATPLFVELAQQLASRSSRRNSGSLPAKAPGALSDLPNEGTGTPGTSLGTLFYLISFGVVATATAVVFFGISFFLLAHPDMELIAGPSARNGGVEVEPQRADLVSPPNKDAAPFPAQTAPAPSVPPEPRSPETHEVLPPASKDAALGSAIAADTGAANATFGVSSNRELWGLRSNADDAALATPSAVPHAARTGISRHRHAGARKHWAAVSRPGVNSRLPPAISAPERAWHWIVQSVTGILASLSPPPSQPPPGFRTR
jgi:hypothetical protein